MAKTDDRVRVPYSAFLRGPSEVLPTLERHDVILERRDGEHLVVSTVSRAEANREGLDLGANALRRLARSHPDLVTDALADALPWLDWLPSSDRSACVAELLADLAASTDVGDFTRFHADLVAWRSSALIHANPTLTAELRRELDGPSGDVPRPGGPGER